MAPSPPLLRTGQPIRERILGFGPAGIGKTHIYLTIAKWFQELGSDAMFYCISSDTAYEPMLSNPLFSELENVDYVDVVDFQQYVDAAKRYNKVSRPQDWMSVDLHSSSWSAAQNEYAQMLARSKGGSLDSVGDIWLETGESKDYPIKGWEWGPINARYSYFAQNLLLPYPGHLFLISEQRDLLDPTEKMKEKEDEVAKKRREMFKHLGVVPAGQKGDPFRYHTILHIDGKAGVDRGQVMSTAKERFGNREMWGQRLKNGVVRDVPLDDFFLDYLVKTAGWTM